MAEFARRPVTTSRWKVLAAFAVLYFGWGGSYLTARFAIETIPPLLSVGSSFVVAGGLLLAWTLFRGAPALRSTDWRRAALLGVLLVLLGMAGVVWAEQRIASGMAALIVSAEPIWMTLYVWRVEHQRPSPRVMLGLFCGMVGIVYLALPQTGTLDAPTLAVLIVASAGWVTGSLYSRHVDLGASEIQGTGLYMFLGGVEVLLLSLLGGEWSRFHWISLSLRSALSWVYSTVVACMIGFPAYLWLLRHVRISKVTTYAFVNPLIALLLGWWLAGEKISFGTGIVSGLLIGGVILVVTSPTTEPSPERIPVS